MKNQLIAALIVLAVLIGLLRWLTVVLNTDKLPRCFPTLDDAKHASDQQIITWVHSLPKANTDEELTALNFILERFINIKAYQDGQV